MRISFLKEKRQLITVVFFFCAFALVSCSKQKPSKSQLLNDIAQFHIDTIDTTGKEQMGTESLDQLLRHYPELYRSAEKSRKAYKKWADTEREMIATALTGEEAQAKSAAAKKQAQLDARLAEMSVTNFLEASLLSEGSTAEESWAETEPTSNRYLQLLARVKPGLKPTPQHAATDEIKSSIGRARRSYLAYIQQLHKTCQALQPEFRADFAAAASRAIRLHLIDLANLYRPYTAGKAVPALAYDAEDEEISNFQAPTPDWFEK